MIFFFFLIVHNYNVKVLKSRTMIVLNIVIIIILILGWLKGTERRVLNAACSDRIHLDFLKNWLKKTHEKRKESGHTFTSLVIVTIVLQRTWTLRQCRASGSYLLRKDRDVVVNRNDFMYRGTATRKRTSDHASYELHTLLSCHVIYRFYKMK